MNTYEHWVAETIASHATRPPARPTMMDTLEFACFQFAVENSMHESVSIVARVRQFAARVSLALGRPSPKA